MSKIVQEAERRIQNVDRAMDMQKEGHPSFIEMCMALSIGAGIQAKRVKILENGWAAEKGMVAIGKQCPKAIQY